MNRAQLDGRALTYESQGVGEPVVLVHGSHIADNADSVGAAV